MVEVNWNRLAAAPEDEWRSYDEFAAGIDTYRIPETDLSGRQVRLSLDDGTRVALRFDTANKLTWSATGAINAEQDTTDPYEAIAVRDDVLYVHLPLRSTHGAALTVIFSTTTHRAMVIHTMIRPDLGDELPRVGQSFFAGTTDGGEPTGEVPGPSRDLIGKRNIYRYSPEHLYEHVYISSQRYAWQCLQGVQRGHGDMDLSTVWRFSHGLYLFCFREFRIAVASVWLHDLGYQLRTTGNFLGIDSSGRTEHSKAGGHIYPLGSIEYPDIAPV